MNAAGVAILPNLFAARQRKRVQLATRCRNKLRDPQRKSQLFVIRVTPSCVLLREDRLRPEDVHFEPGMAAVFAYRSNLYQHAPTPFEDCFKVGEAHHENVFGAIERLVAAGEQVGFSAHDLISMLKGGMTLENVLDLIEVRMTGTCAGAQSKVA